MTTYEDPHIGVAKFYNLVGAEEPQFNLKDAAWYFPNPKPGFEKLKDCLAFRKFEIRKDVGEHLKGSTYLLGPRSNWAGRYT